MSSLETVQSQNHYELLGADPLATLDQIEGLFRDLAEDAQTTGDEAKVRQAIEAFKVLRDPEQRQQYDQQLGEESSIAAEQQSADGGAVLSVVQELEITPDVLAAHRRELLKMFYEKKRKDMRNSGIAIGGLDSLVSYSYELLEFHLWVLSEKKYVLREASGALSISASGCESHEQNLMDGLVQPGK